jgi:hypothetical protein
METTLDGTTIALRAEQRPKASSPILVTLTGSVIVTRAVQRANVRSSILVKAEGASKVTEASFEQPKNAWYPRDLTLVGTKNVVSAEQP